LPELVAVEPVEPFLKLGAISPSSRELLGLTPREREAVEETLHRHVADANARMAAGIIETNKPLEGSELAGKVFILPKFDDEGQEREERTLAELREILGEERWSQMQARQDAFRELDIEGGLLRIDEGTSSLSAVVDIDESGTLIVYYTTSGNPVTHGTKPLSMFLPEGDPNRTDGADDFGRNFLAEALRQRTIAWLQEQAIAQGRKP
jgi:hypothetical protein